MLLDSVSQTRSILAELPYGLIVDRNNKIVTLFPLSPHFVNTRNVFIPHDDDSTYVSNVMQHRNHGKYFFVFEAYPDKNHANTILNFGKIQFYFHGTFISYRL